MWFLTIDKAPIDTQARTLPIRLTDAMRATVTIATDMARPEFADTDIEEFRAFARKFLSPDLTRLQWQELQVRLDQAILPAMQLSLDGLVWALVADLLPDSYLGVATNAALSPLELHFSVLY